MPTNLQEFLEARKAAKESFNFTSFKGGKWLINSDDLDEFYKLYCDEIENSNPQFLIERPTSVSMLKVDFDMKYEGEKLNHPHTEEQINLFVNAWLTQMKEYIQLPETVEVFALEKDRPTYSTKKDNNGEVKKISRSGIHLQVPDIKTYFIIQQSVRRTLLPRMEEFFGTELGIINNWKDVYDEAVLKKTQNWTLLGSKKAEDGCLPYKLKYSMIWNSETKNITIDKNINKHVTPELLRKHTVQSLDSELTPLTQKGIELKESERQHEPVTHSISRGRSNVRDEEPNSRSSSPGRNYIAPLTETREKYVRAHIMNLNAERYTNYSEWAKWGQCLKNIHPDLENVWLDFSAQYPEYNEIQARRMWNSFGLRVEGERISEKSLRFYSRLDNSEEYEHIEKNNVDRLVDESAASGTEYDVAMVIFARYRDDFKCAQFKNNDWYHYVGHIWHNTENGVELQRRLSSDIAKLYSDKEKIELVNIDELDKCPPIHLKEPDPSCSTCQAEKRKKQYSNLRTKLRTTKFKENVMKECRALFFDKDFAMKLDENKHLIAFNNGVYDTLTQTFRVGTSEDCISFCTNIDFAVDTQYHQFDCWPELEKFLKSILPNKNVRVYFLKHLATCLSGVFNQSFHILTGSGSNGKSMLMNLTSTAFGDYCYKANIAMFTQKRGRAGAASPEMVRMKGRRFVMMSEPDEDTPLSTGFMKEITSSEKVSARDLFQGSKQMVEFDVQAKCHLACNEKPKVNTTDGGTWRRLRVIDFPNKFVHEPRLPNELPMDETIMQKVLSPEWAECFMAYLVHLHMEGKGLTKLNPPKEVEVYTNEYKEESDAVAKFMSEYIHPAGPTMGDAPADGILWTTILAEFNAWKRNNEITKASAQELRKRLEQEHGKLPSGGWTSFHFGSS